MSQSNYQRMLDLESKIFSQIQGGFEGLEILFSRQINILKGDKFVLNHSDFKNFYNGIPIKVLGVQDKVFIENKGKMDDLSFNNFFEKYYEFKFEPTPHDVFYSSNNVLQIVLRELTKVQFDDKFSENEKKLLINKIVLYISEQIKKSDNANKRDNPVLFDKLIYICNGYKLTYNKIFELFGDNYISIKKSKFKTDNKVDNDIWRNIFNSEDDFEKFKYYVKNKITDDYADLSYLFQKLLDDKRITKIQHLKFNTWLFKNKFIKENIFNNINDNGGFRSLDKSFSQNRENNYLEVFKN